MSTGDLLSVQPAELKFPFEPKKQSSCSLQLINNSDHYVAFKVKTTSPKKYCVRPNNGILLPKSTCEVTVTMQSQREAPPDMQCKDKFLLQSVIAPYGMTPKDVTQDMFSKEVGKVVEECKLRVAYVPPPQPPSPVPEGSEEGSPPKASLLGNGNQHASLFDVVPKDLDDMKAKFIEARTAISKLTDEKNSAVQQNQQLRQELALMKQGTAKAQGGFSFLFVFLVALMGILVGYLVHS